MNSILLILAIAAVSVAANKYGSKYNFQFGKQPKQPLFMQPPSWNAPSNPTNWPSSSSQPINWQNQPSLTWPGQPSIMRPNQQYMNWPSQPSQNMPYWPNQSSNIPGGFGQGNQPQMQMPSRPIPQTNLIWQSPQERPGSYMPSYGGSYPNPQMYLYRNNMKKPEKS